MALSAGSVLPEGFAACIPTPAVICPERDAPLYQCADAYLFMPCSAPDLIQQAVYCAFLQPGYSSCNGERIIINGIID